MSKPAILIVEDEAIVAMDLAMKLGALGYEVIRTVSTGEEALTVAEQQHPDLILLDLKLAGASEGIQTAQQLKRYDIPVVFLTANSERETLNRVNVLEPAGYILKPFGERDLATQIDIALYKAQTNRILRCKDEELRRSHDELAQEAAALTRLTELSSRLWQKRTLPEGLDEMLAATIELVGADKGNIQFMTDGDVLVIAAQHGFDDEFLTFFKEVSIQDNSACGRALGSGKRIIVEDIESDPDFTDLRPIARKAGYRAVQSTPLFSSTGQPLGMLSTHWQVAHRPTPTDLHRLDLYARQAADFIERQTAEAALRESEERFRRLVEVSSEMVWTTDSDGIPREDSPSWRAFTGFSLKRYINGREWLEAIHPEDRQGVAQVWEEACHNRSFYTIEARMRRADGVYRRILARALPLLDSHGTVRQWVGMNTDVTDFRASEEALRESEERLRAVVETAVDGIMTIDEEGIIESVNPAVERIFQYSVEELIGRNIKLLMPEPHRHQHDDYLRRYRDTGEKKIIGIGREVMGRRKDGSLCPVELSISESRLPGKRFFTGILREITARKQAEQTLRESEQRLRAFLDNSAVIAWLKDEDGRNVFLSENYARRFDLRDWKDKTDFELWPPDIAEVYRNNDLKVLANDQPLEVIEQARMADGTVSFWLNSKFWFEDASGRKFVGGVGVEITERKRAEAALRESEERLRLANLATNEAIWDWNVASDAVVWNHNIATLFGWSEVADSSQPAAWWVERVHPEDRTRVADHFFAAVNDPTIVSWSDEYRFRKADGSYAYVFDRAYAVRDASGKAVRMLGTMLDITERKQVETALGESEERLRLAAEGGNLGMWFWDVLKDDLVWTDRCKELFGLPPGGGALTYAEFLNALYPDDRERTHEAVMCSNRDGVPYDIEYRALWPDGTIHWIAAKGQSYFDDKGRVVRMHGIVLDIDNRKRAEDALREAQEKLQRWNLELERAVTAKTADLLSSEERLRALARELNLAEQRERKRLATEMHDHLQQLLVLGKMQIGQGKRFALGMPACESVMRRVDDILSDALTYTRTLVAELSPPVLRDHGLAAGLKWLGEYMQKHNLTVTVTVSDGAEVDLPEDQVVLLFQSVRELLMNSWKHAGTGGASIVMDRRDGQLVVQVTDEGKGFDLAAAATPNGGLSSKFGLFSIRERMRAMGGSLQVQSELNQGTCVTLILPLETASLTQEVPQEEVRRLSGSRAAPIGDGRREKGVRVVLVDDHAMVRQGLRSILTGYSDMEIVGEAANGVEALCAVEQHRPTVVIMDINMPRMDGIEATARIKARYPEIFVIGLSVNAGSENQQAMQNAGAAALLTKEAVVEQLYGAIQEAVNGRCERNDMSASNQARV